jgi:hypothetical protein
MTKTSNSHNKILDEAQDEYLATRPAEAATREKYPQGHGEPCYYCGEGCNSFAGNPNLWPLPLCHPDDPGKVKWHHTGCISDRLHGRVPLSTHQQQERVCNCDAARIEAPGPDHAATCPMAHQQQGADNALAAEIRAVDAGICEHGLKGYALDAMSDLLRRAARALSRTPQPDTVTEEMVDIAIEARGDYLFGFVGQHWTDEILREGMRIGITAALNAKGK